MTDREKESPNDDFSKSKRGKPYSTGLVWTKKSLLERLRKGPEARAKFVASQISNGIAFQIRAMRKRNQLSQPQLAELVETTQNQIYRLENPSTAKPTITTLKKVAAAFDVALVVRFEPFTQLVDWVSGTPFEDRGISSEAIAVPSFSDELQILLGPIPANINVTAQVQTTEFSLLPGVGTEVIGAAGEINPQFEQAA